MQNLKQNAIPLHDIKPLIEIHEYSLYYFIGVSLLAALILLGFIYLAYKWYKSKKKFNIRAEHYKLLNTVDYSNPKKAAYDLTFYGATFIDDSERHLRAFENMIEQLEKYKYKKNVENFDVDTLHVIDFFNGMIDV